MLFMEFNLVYVTLRKFLSSCHVKIQSAHIHANIFHAAFTSNCVLVFKFYITLDAFLNAVINTVITFNAIIVP